MAARALALGFFGPVLTTLTLLGGMNLIWLVVGRHYIGNGGSGSWIALLLLLALLLAIGCGVLSYRVIRRSSAPGWLAVIIAFLSAAWSITIAWLALTAVLLSSAA